MNIRGGLKWRGEEVDGEWEKTRFGGGEVVRQ